MLFVRLDNDFEIIGGLGEKYIKLIVFILVRDMMIVYMISIC